PPELTLTLGVLLALALFSNVQGKVWTRPRTLCTIFVLAALVHAALVKLEWFFRYEAYLMALGIVGLSLVAADAQAREVAVRQFRRNVAGGILHIQLEH